MQKNSDLSTGISGLFWMSFMTICGYIIQLIITFFLARLLTPADYGEMAAINVLVGFADIFWMMGVGPAIVQKKDLVKEDILTGNTLNLLFGFVVFAVINISTSFLCNIFNISNPLMLRTFSMVFILHSLSGVSQSLTQKKCKYKQISTIRVFSTVVFGCTAISLALMDFKAWSLVIAKLAQATCATIAYLIIEPISFKIIIKKESSKRLLYFGGGFTMARVFSYIANNGDYLVVNKKLGKVLLGSYNKAYQLLMYPVTLIGETLDQVLFPLLSKNQESKNKLAHVFVMGICLIVLISIPISLVAFICAEPLVYFALGEQWGEVILPFKIMVLGLFFRIGYKLSDSLVRSLGKVYHRAFIQALYALLVVIGAFIGHYFGLVGVAFGVTCAFTINYFLMSALSMHLLNIKIRSLIKVSLPLILYGAILLFSIFIIKPYVFSINNNFLICLITTIVIFAVYFLAFICTRKKILSKEFNIFIDLIINNLLLKFKMKLK